MIEVLTMCAIMKRQVKEDTYSVRRDADASTPRAAIEDEIRAKQDFLATLEEARARNCKPTF